MGMLPALSGPLGASSGTPMLRAAQLAAGEVNAAGGLWVNGQRVRVTLVHRDVHDTQQGAVSGVRTLINEEHVAVLVGPQLSTQAMAAAALAENARIPLLSPGGTHPDIDRGRAYAFRASVPNEAQAAALASFAVTDLRASRAAVLYNASNVYSSGVASAFRATFQQRGGRVVAFETYTTDAADDLGSQLARVIAARPQVLVLPNYSTETPHQLRQARALGYRGIFLGTDSWEGRLATAGLPELEGGYFAHTWDSRSADSAAVSFRARFRAAYGVDPNATAAATYDVMRRIFAAAAGQGSVQPDAIRRGLATAGVLHGASGTIRFASGGEPTRAILISQVRGGRQVVRRRLEPGAPRQAPR